MSRLRRARRILHLGIRLLPQLLPRKVHGQVQRRILRLDLVRGVSADGPSALRQCHPPPRHLLRSPFRPPLRSRCGARIARRGDGEWGISREPALPAFSSVRSQVLQAGIRLHPGSMPAGTAGVHPSPQAMQRGQPMLHWELHTEPRSRVLRILWPMLGTQRLLPAPPLQPKPVVPVLRSRRHVFVQRRMLRSRLPRVFRWSLRGAIDHHILQRGGIDRHRSNEMQWSPSKPPAHHGPACGQKW